MENKTEFIIDKEGRFYREDSVRTEIDPGPELEKCFKTTMSVKLTSLISLPTWGVVSVSVDDIGLQHWSVPIAEIKFNTSFRVKGEGATAELIPLFVESKSEPSMSIDWRKSDALSSQSKGMDIRFVAVIQFQTNGLFRVQKQYLYAFDDAKNGYRLPLSNLYDTCELCNGVYNSEDATAIGTLTRALNQFRNSSWNSDLLKDVDVIENFIRFKPLETGFQTLPIKGIWTKHCEKVSTPIMKHIIV